MTKAVVGKWYLVLGKACDPLPDLSAWGRMGSAGVEWGRNWGEGVGIEKFVMLRAENSLNPTPIGDRVCRRGVKKIVKIAESTQIRAGFHRRARIFTAEGAEIAEKFTAG